MSIIKRVKVGESGQIVIPKAMRKSMGIVPKEEVNLSMDEGGIVICPAKRSLARHCEEMLKECGLRRGERTVTGDELYDEIFSGKYDIR